MPKATPVDRLRSVADVVDLFTAIGGRFDGGAVIVARLAATQNWWWSGTRGTFGACAYGILDDMGYAPAAAWPQARRTKVLFGKPIEGHSARPTIDEIEARLGCRLEQL